MHLLSYDIQQDSEINVLWFMASGKKKFFAQHKYDQMCSCREQIGIELPKIIFLYNMEGDCDHMYVSACHVIILYFSASLHW